MIVPSRRGLLGMFAAGAAAAIVRPGVLMPVKARLLTPREIVDMALQRIGNPPLDVIFEWQTEILRNLSNEFNLRPGSVNRGPLLTLLTPPPIKFYTLAGAA